jgi:hypothetical protein
LTRGKLKTGPRIREQRKGYERKEEEKEDEGGGVAKGTS